MPQYTAPRPQLLGQRKPRNPFVAHGQLRQAGRHAPAHARQAANKELDRALQSELREPWRPPTSTD